MVHRLRIFLSIALLGLAGYGCDRDPSNGAVLEHLDKGVAPEISPGAVVVDEEKERYLFNVKKELNELRAQIDALKAEHSQYADAALQSRIEELEREWRAADEQISRIQAASGGSWREAKPALDHAVERMKQALASTEEHFG